ncbi:MAG TPA: arsenite methyltransferase [Bacteroidota bacterium]|nr:arsenite methyltransferase [Bacteroidota bacterium]
METQESIKEMVKEKYGDIAKKSKSREGLCCGSDQHVVVMTEDYSGVGGYEPDADLGLGCGIPTDVANITRGETVLDLGCGAGNDVFVARSLVGETGRVIGVDMTEAMIQRAEANRKKLGFENVEFRLGEIEKLPVESQTVDVIVSNCVLNLVPDKSKAFTEIFRVLKPGGRFAISDIVTTGELPRNVRTAAELYAGCIAGAMPKDQYLNIIRESGFIEPSIEKERPIGLPDETLAPYLSVDEIDRFRSSKSEILSITVRGKKKNGNNR